MTHGSWAITHNRHYTEPVKYSFLSVETWESYVTTRTWSPDYDGFSHEKEHSVAMRTFPRPFYDHQQPDRPIPQSWSTTIMRTPAHTCVPPQGELTTHQRRGRPIFLFLYPYIKSHFHCLTTEFHNTGLYIILYIRVLFSVQLYA